MRQLPPSQKESSVFPRFGMPQFADRIVPADQELSIEVWPYRSFLFGLFLLASVLLDIRGSFVAGATAGSPNTQNLINDASFEADGEDWIICGGTEIVDGQQVSAEFVRTGRYALRMGQPIDTSCGNDTLGPSQIAVEDITIPSNAQDVTISFWYKAVGGYPAGEVAIALGEKPTSYLADAAFFTAIQMDDLMPGWQLFRQNFTGEQLEAVRGKTLYLKFYVYFQGEASHNWSIYFDDVRAVPFWERTLPSPLPADLRGDGAQPLLVRGTNQAGDAYGIQRMDTDGGNRVLLYESLLQPKSLAWSPNGSQFAFSEDRPFPDPPISVDNFHAIVSDTYLMNPDGSSGRKIFETTGVIGQKERPIGCLRTNSCADSGQNAIDIKVQDLTWSPDGAQLISTICTEGRWWSGDKDITGCSHHLSLQPVPAGAPVDITLEKFIDVAQNADWHANGQLLFQRPPSIGNGAQVAGLWRADMTQQQPPRQLIQTWLTANSNGNPDLRPSPELVPAWAPDGRHYVTVRNAQGNRYVEKLADDASLSALRVNRTIMLHDSQDPAATRQLLYVDQGTLTSRPTWSPDGRYLLYIVLADNEESSDIWWLDVDTGATGQVTNDGVSYGVDWLPTHNFKAGAPQPTAGPSPTPNPALDKQIYLPAISGGNGSSGGPTPQPTTPGGIAVSFPTVTPTATPPPLTTPVNPTPVPPRGIHGRVVYNGAGVGGVNVQLEVCNVGGSCEVKERAATDADGEYNFPYAATYNGVFSYQVTYRNGDAGENAFDERYLSYWQEPRIFDYDFAQRVEGGDFDIATVELTAPVDGAQVPLPATFSWQSRGFDGEEYRWFMDAAEDFVDACDQFSPDTNTSFEVTGFDCSVFPELSAFEPYPWQVEVSNSEGGKGQSQVQIVTFTR